MSLHRFRKLLVTGVAVSLAAMVAACGGQSGSDAHDNSQKQVKIGIGLTATGIPSLDAIGTGAKAAASAIDAKVEVVGPATPSGAGEATMAQNLAISFQPDGFGLNPCILEAWQRTISATIASVPSGNVVAVGCPPISAAGDSTPIKTFVGPSGYAQGYVTAEAAIEGGHIPSSVTGTALVAGCDPSVPNIVTGVKGVVAALQEKLPGLHVVTFTSALDQTANTAAWTSAFAKQSDVALAVGFCDQDSASLLTLKQRGVGGNFVAGAAEPTGVVLKGIKDGLIAGGAQQAAWLQGYLTAALLAMKARGESIPTGWIDSGNYVITAKNVDAWIAAGESEKANADLLTPVAKKILADLAGSTSPLDDYFSTKEPPSEVIG